MKKCDLHNSSNMRVWQNMDTTIRSALKNCVERNSQNSKSSSDGPFQALFHFSELTDTSANGYESIVPENIEKYGTVKNQAKNMVGGARVPGVFLILEDSKKKSEKKCQGRNTTGQGTLAFS